MIIAYFPPVLGGAEIQALRLAKALSKRNVNPFVITQRLKGLKRFEEVEGVPIYRLFTLGSGTVASLLFMFSSFLFLVKNRRKYQIIHAHLASSPAITATIAGKVLRKKVIVKFGRSGKTGDIQTSDRTCLGRAKLKLLMKYADVLICPSEEVKRESIDYGFAKNNVIKIPNGVDTALFHPVSDLQKEDLKRRFNFPSLPTLCSVGRLEPVKGLVVLLRAWQKVIKFKEESYLLIVGEGSQKNNLINLGKQLRIIESVRFIGQVDNVNEYLQTGDGFLFPSFGEGLSNALLEAMASELPVVATKIGGTEEVIENKKNGILVEAGSVDKLAKGIITLLRRPEAADRLGREARRTIEENYSIGVVAQKYLEVYKEMIK